MLFLTMGYRIRSDSAVTKMLPNHDNKKHLVVADDLEKREVALNSLKVVAVTTDYL